MIKIIVPTSSICPTKWLFETKNMGKGKSYAKNFMNFLLLKTRNNFSIFSSA